MDDDGGYTEYEVETLFCRARTGKRPPRMSPRQAADYERMLAEHPDAELPPHGW